MLSREEQERAAYLAGDTEKAELLAMAQEVEDFSEPLSCIPVILEAVEEMGGIDLIREKLEELENYKEFFHDCFSRLAGHYPCPSVTSDHDKNVIFAAIDKGEGISTD